MPNSSSQKPIKADAVVIPDIAIQADKAFYPLRFDPSDKKIKPSYQNDICTKKFLGICTKWEKRTIFFDNLEWFYTLGFGLYKLPELK